MTILDQHGQPIPSQVKQTKPDLREIAVVTVRDRYSSYPSSGLTPEKLALILREADLGDMYRTMELFEDIEEKDLHLLSVMQTRKNTVIGLDWEIIAASDEPKDQEIANFVGEVLADMDDLDDAFLDLLDAIGKGYAISEIMWEIKDGKAIPAELKWRHQKKIRFDEIDTMRLLTLDNQYPGIELPPNKFIVHQYKGRSGHPSRAGLFRVCVWMYLFKNYTLKDWISFAEVYGMPLRLGKYDASASKEEKDALIQAIIQIGTDAAGIISKSTEIEFVEAMKADGDIFENLARFCNSEMSKAVLGQTLTSDIGDSGSYAAGQVHNEVRMDILQADCKSLQKTIRRYLIKPLVLFNFGPVNKLPSLKFKHEKSEDREKESKTYNTLVDMGLPISTEHVYEKFGIPKPQAGQEILQSSPQPLSPLANKMTTLALNRNPPAAFDRHQTSIEGLAAAALAESAPAFQAIIRPLLKIINEADSLDELPAKLLEAYPSINTADLEDLIARSLYVADLYGRWAVKNE
ncbi:MAG: DUF935 domain-containing protein [Negativicutes bacterium]|nr:DUF935 domain-containing protein [Negativicutes bacterium]